MNLQKLISISLIVSLNFILLSTRPVDCAATSDASAQARPIRLSFSNIDASDVLQAVARYYKANIVFPAQSKKAISLNASASSVEEALRLVTATAGMAYRQTGETYVVGLPADLKGMIEPLGERARIRLNTLTPAQAVQLLEGALPYLTARPAGTQVLVIGASEDIAQARALLQEQDPATAGAQVNDVVTLQYAASNQVAAMLKSMFPNLKADAIGTADKPGGAIGLVGARTQVEGAKEAIRTIDVSTVPREPDRLYRVYSIKYSSAPLLKDFMDKAAPDVSTLIGPEHYSPLMPAFRPLSGATLGTSSLGGGSGSGGGVGGGFSSGGTGGGGGMSGAGGFGGAGGQTEQRKQRDGDRSKSLVLSGTPQNLDAAFKLLEDIDLKPKQVMVDVKVVDTSPERAEELGLKWNWQPFNFLEQPVGTPVTTNNGVVVPSANTTRPNVFGQISRMPWSFGSVLSAMVTRKEAKLLADPRIQVTDNDDANIFIGDTIRARIAQASSLGAQTIDIVEFPIGIVLLVRPRVNGDGNITMRVHPVVSTITSVDSNNIPQTSSREAETTVMVKDGETVVIGGLIRDELSKTIQEVPFLAKLPLVGELFRNRSTNHRHSEILVFITPHVVK